MQPHITVLLKQTIECLKIDGRENLKIVDATCGYGGHTEALCDALGKGSIILSLDADTVPLASAKERIEKHPKVISKEIEIIFMNKNFGDLGKAIKEAGFDSVDGIIFDLGLNSVHLDSSGKGFSFSKDEPLDMRYGLLSEGQYPHTAEEIVNTFSEENLADVIYGFGEETAARKIARAIVEERKINPIKSSKQLEEIIFKAMPFVRRFGKTHPATKTFQALRIAVNHELENLEKALEDSLNNLSTHGRAAFISFHSLEDRLVKRFIIDKVKEEKVIAVTKKPIVPSKEEIEVNPRSRSAKLRCFEKIQ